MFGFSTKAISKAKEIYEKAQKGTLCALFSKKYLNNTTEKKVCMIQLKDNDGNYSVIIKTKDGEEYTLELA